MTDRRGFLASLPTVAGSLSAEAAARPAPQEPPGSCNVMRFGATGDGVTDDTAAFRSAIEACPQGGRLEIPAGRRFRIGRITITKNLVVDAQGASLVLSGPQAGVTVEGAITLLRVLGGTVIGTGTPEDRQMAWTIGNTPASDISNVVLDGVTTLDCAVGIKVAGTPTLPVRHVTVRDCRVTHSIGSVSGVGYGIQFTYADYGKIVACHLEACERHAVYLTQGRHYVVMGNTFREHRRTVATLGFRAALAIARSENVTAVANVFDGCHDGALGVESDEAGTACRNVTISGNTFLNSHLYDVVVGNDDPVIGGQPEHVVLVANTFRRDPETRSGTAIDIRCGKYVVVGDNSFVHLAAGVGNPTGVFVRGTGGDHFTDAVQVHHNVFHLEAADAPGYAIEIGAAIAQGRSTVRIRDNLDQSSGGVLFDARRRNPNLVMER